MPPSTAELISALTYASEILGEAVVYHHDGRFHFPLGGAWTAAVSSDDAGRLRVEACYRSRPRARLWCEARDRLRLAHLVLSLRETVAEPV